MPSKSRWHFGNVQHWQTLTFNLPKIIGQGQRIHRLAEVCALQALTKVLTYCWWVHRMWKQASHGQTDSQVWQLFAYALTAKRHNRYASAYLMSNTSGNLELNFALKSPSFLHLPLNFFFFFWKHLIFSLSCQKIVELLWMRGKSILILQFAASAKNWIAFVCSKLPSYLWPAGWYCEGENGPFFLTLFFN